jgi:hypothetical protein
MNSRDGRNLSTSAVGVGLGVSPSMFKTETSADKAPLIRPSAGWGGTTNVLQGIAALAIAAPRRIIAVALLVMVAFHLSVGEV